MSRTHARVRTGGTPEKVGFWRHVAVGAGVLFIAGLIAFGSWWSPSIEDSHVTTPGRVLETRIAICGTQDSLFGGYILYRIEAHVRYDRHGQVQDRWMPASEISSSRDTLALRLVKPPGACEVYWAPGHPENPRCDLK
jgi:hypothetical protein